MKITDDGVKEGRQFHGRKAVSRVFRAVILALLLCASASRAETAISDGATSYGFETYFRHHPPKERMASRNPYPFPGPVIAPGKDIPVCAAARSEAAYASPGMGDMRYVLHGRDGWLFRTSDFRTDFSASPETIKYFDRLNRTLVARGQTLIVALQPPRALMAFQHTDPAAAPKDYSPEKARAGYRDFIAQLAKAGIKVVDLSAAPENADYFERADFHWSSAGAAWSAERVARTVRELPVYSTLPRQKFQTSVTGLAAPSRGTLAEFVQQTCGVNIQMTSAPIRTTVPQARQQAKTTAFPGITLLGTGNSANDQKFGFAGRLKALLETDIYNAAVAGGSAGLSPYIYLASDEYRQHPPKVIIWELPSNYNYNSTLSHAGFRQVLSAIDGGCGDKTAVARWSGNLDAHQTSIFDGIQKIPLQDTYLYVEASGVMPGPLKAEILYGDGEADEIDMTGSRSRTGNRYYLELRGAAAPAQFVHLSGQSPGASLVARLCRSAQRVAEK
jgi:alginate biosynthesis protein AlgX